MFAKLDRLLGRIERLISGTMLLIMIGVIVTNIALRFFTGETITWAEDAAIFLMIIMTFFGAAYTTRLNRHITMNAFYEITTGKLRLFLYLIGLLVLTAFTVFLFLTSLEVTHTIYQLRGMIPSINLPKYWPYLLVSIAVLFMAIHFLYLLMRFLFSRQADDALQTEE